MTAKNSYKETLQKVKALEKESMARKELEAQLKEQTEFLKSVLGSLAHPFYVIDANDYTVRLANSAALKSSSSGEATCYALAHKRNAPCDASGNPCPLEIIKKTKKPLRIEHVHYDKDGKPRHVEVHAYPILGKDGNVTQIIEYMLDITERKNIETALKESETKFRSVAQSATDAIITADKDSNIVFCNTAAKKMFGYDADKLIGEPLQKLMPERFKDAHERGMAKAASSDESGIIGQTVELMGLTRQRAEFPLELSLAKWTAGDEIYFTGIIRDITHRKQREKERDRLIESLQENLAKVKTLSGLLPICASCKKIRDDKGYWNQIEAYIRDRSEAEFSHGICPDCSEKLYPEYHRQGRLKG
jgi:PAS domain S-box-containing protein